MTFISTPQIEDIANTKFDELLKQVQLGECNVFDSGIDERHDMSKELLAIVSDPADDTLSKSGIHVAPRE